METSSKKVPGPDQGIGWVIAFACFFINFIMAGLARTAGVLFVALIDLYGVSREAATTPFSVRVCVRNMTGPVIGLLGQKYGIRGVTILGGLVAGVGSILCCFAPNILWITMFWGVIHGLGFGLSTVLHMMVIGQYFDKYKASALGLGYSGDCFGTFAFPVIIEHLLSTYDIKGTFLILGGIVMNVIPMAMLLKKPPWLKSLKKNRNLPKTIPTISGTDMKTHSSTNVQTSGYSNKAFSNSEAGLMISNNEDMTRITNTRDNLEGLPSYKEATTISHGINYKKSSPLPSLCGSLRSHRAQNEFLEHVRENIEQHDSLPPVSEIEDLPPDGSNENENNSFVKSEPTSERCLQLEGEDLRIDGKATMKKRTSSFVEVAQDLVNRMRTASFASQVAQDAFVCNINQESKEENEPEFVQEGEPESTIKSEVSANASAQSEIKTVQLLEVPEVRAGTNTQNKADSDSRLSTTNVAKQSNIWMTLLRTNMEPMFILISLTMAIYAYLFVGVLTIIIDYAVDLGVSQDQAKYLIIGFSVADLIGRLSFGQVIDRNMMKMKNYTAMNMVLMGMLVAVIPLNTSFRYTMVCMCTYGLFQGGTAIMFPILVSNYMEKNQESVAMGCLNFYGGLLMLLMAPMIGYFRDNTGSYNSVFHIIGGTTTFVGILWLFEPLILKFQNEKLRKRHLKMNENDFICTKL